MSKGITLSNSSSSSALTQNHSQPLSTASSLHLLFESIGWRDISKEVGEKQLEELTTQQSLIATVQIYEDSPSDENNQKVVTALAKEITRIESERDYALNIAKKLQKQMRKEQRAAEKAAAEFKPASSYWESLQQISSHFSESITTRVKTFFGSTTAQQVEKYRESAQNREKELSALRSYREKIQMTEVMTALIDDEPPIEMSLAHNRHLLQTSTPPEMTYNFCEPSGSCSLAGLSDGQLGFTLLGDSYSSFAVSRAGDINGDGLDDILVGYTPVSGGAGKAALIFGSKLPGAWGSGLVNLLTLADGHRGFFLVGGHPGDYLGAVVSSAGDINGDRLADILIGSWGGGKTTVVFGSNKTGAWGSGTLNLTILSDGQRAFTLQGKPGDYDGFSVSGAGDINGDGLDDILVGAPYASNTTGKITVVFGSNKIGVWGSGTLNLTTLADGKRGFVLLGQIGDYLGFAVGSVGDFNGDGLGDIVVATPYYAGKTTVVFGSNKTSAWGSGVLSLSTLADGQRGFMLQGQPNDLSGYSVGSAGDINGDGLDDILIGGYDASGAMTTVVFGSTQSGAWGSGTLNLTTLADGQRGFVILGGKPGGLGNHYLSSAGDINGDHLDDLLIGAPSGYPIVLGSPGGQVTVVLGSNQPGAWGSGVLSLGTLTDGQRGFVLTGQPVIQNVSPDQTGSSVSSAGDGQWGWAR